MPLFGFRGYLRVHLPPFKVKSFSPFPLPSVARSRFHPSVAQTLRPLFPHNSAKNFRRSQVSIQIKTFPGALLRNLSRRSSLSERKSLFSLYLRNLMDDSLIVTLYMKIKISNHAHNGSSSFNLR